MFKIDRGPAGEKIAYARLFSGTVRIRDRIAVGPAQQSRVTGVRVFVHGGDEPREVAVAGQIAKLSGLVKVRIGDVLGSGGSSAEHFFAPPTLETVVVPERPADRGALYAALSQLAEQDPLINLRADGEGGQIALSLYGEVQKEVIEATLAEEYGVEVSFTETTTLCIERPVGIGEAIERIGTDANPILAGVGLRVEPAPAGSGVSYRLAGEVRGTMPVAFFNAVEESVHRALQRGLRGWPVTDCEVTLDPHRLLPEAEPCSRHLRQVDVQHGGRLPAAHTRGAGPGAGRGRHRGVRADPPLPARAARGSARADPAGAGRARRHPAQAGRRTAPSASSRETCRLPGSTS